LTICTFVVSELVKTRLNRGQRADLYFFRDSNGNEVDVIAEVGDRLQPIEIKSGQTLNRDFFTGLERYMALAGTKVVAPSLVYGGKEALERKGIRVWGWHAAGRVLEGSQP
jgi:uncharacterized protein